MSLNLLRTGLKRNRSSFSIRNDFNKTWVCRGSDVNTINHCLQQRNAVKLPHVMFLGETNAGKSSLINSLLKKKQLAKSSSRAAKTQSVDLYGVNERFILVDTPGFSFAKGKLSRLWEKEFFPLIQRYVENCGQNKLRLLVIVQDVNQQVKEEDYVLLGKLRQWDLPTLLVLTKDDKLFSHRQRILRTNNIKTAMDFDGSHIHYTINANNPKGRRARRALARFIDDVVNASDIAACHQLLDKKNARTKGTSDIIG
mmetsp:Transcript_12348/g.14302  ORF Transcript_12348/g.14302 Transcript_12348/m.14302 type:complete len:255 (-) Transcript_12348:212-976(-)